MYMLRDKSGIDYVIASSDGFNNYFYFEVIETDPFFIGRSQYFTFVN